jgi:hypothetical protein
MLHPLSNLLVPTIHELTELREDSARPSEEQQQPSIFTIDPCPARDYAEEDDGKEYHVFKTGCALKFLYQPGEHAPTAQFSRPHAPPLLHQTFTEQRDLFY